MDTNYSSGNKRVAKNTLIVYFRIVVTTIVGLVSSRLVLQALGASDYGLYNVVGGIIAMFLIISGSMATTTTRFLNVEMGKPNGNVNRVFNMSFTLHIVFSLLILLLLESIGIIYILNYLKVDPGKEADAMFVFQVSTIVACIGVINIPFQSIFIAYEKFSSIAIIDIAKYLILLLLCFLLIYWKGNALRFYALSMCFTNIISFLVYYFISAKRWPQVIKWNFVKDIKGYKDLFIYNNWTLLGSAADVARNQGSNMIINLFFGTVVNAAYAISYQVMHHIAIFITNFDKAVAPQIVQNIGAGCIERSIYLATHVCRLCVLLVEILFFTLYVELEFVLRLWLGDNIPEGTVLLCHYVLLIVIISSTGGGLLQLINGLKEIKWFKVAKFTLYILCLPCGYVAFKLGAPVHTIVIFFLISDFLNRAFQLIFLKKLIPFSIIGFIKEAYWRPILVFVIMFFFIYLYDKLSIESDVSRMFGILSMLVISSLFAFFVGLRSHERNLIVKRFFKR